MEFRDGLLSVKQIAPVTDEHVEKAFRMANQSNRGRNSRLTKHGEPKAVGKQVPIDPDNPKPPGVPAPKPTAKPRK